MFAPPPLQLTQAQIEQLKLEREAREAAKKGADGSDRSGSHELQELQRTDTTGSGSSKKSRKSTRLGKKGKSKASSPVFEQKGNDSTSLTSLESPVRQEGAAEAVRKPTYQRVKPPAPPPVSKPSSFPASSPLSVTQAFGEKPRKAPIPPKRPSRPASDLLFLPSPVPPLGPEVDILEELRRSQPALKAVAPLQSFPLASGQVTLKSVRNSPRSLTAVAPASSSQLSSTYEYSILQSLKTGPPPLPLAGRRSPQRHGAGAKPQRPARPDEQPKQPYESLFTEASLNTALAERKASDFSKAKLRNGRPTLPLQISTENARAGKNPSPVAKSPAASTSRLRHTTSGGSSSARARASSKLSRTSERRSGKIDKLSSTVSRLSTGTAVLEAMKALDDMNFEIKHQLSRPPTDTPDHSPTKSSSSPGTPNSATPWKRKRKGETMSMLLDSGFFPIKDPATGEKIFPKHAAAAAAGLRITVPVRVPPHILNKALPATPGISRVTPTEMVKTSPKRPQQPGRVKKKAAGQKQRGPLAQISANEAKARERMSQPKLQDGGLGAIPEQGSGLENSAPSSGDTTPTATHIHLRNGSVITLTPPELTPWQTHVYLQGPIRLPTPVVMPRKNSVASLAPFQDAIDDTYLDAMPVARRRSDDVVVDHICDWFDEFGFTDWKFDGDALMVEDISISEDPKDHRGDQEGGGGNLASVNTLDTAPTPVQRLVAKKVVEKARRSMISTLPVEPVASEATLRARGRARLARQAAGERAGRKESATLPTHAMLLPVPEQSMLDSRLPSPGRKP